ncbi:LacI family DNA-binding transcriptional regulator [Microlunatus speluncae]|uniref:LacI family DNA-binding transcriptional regulator n=1 Tax=Microlunatus speluncae TaxID=2594267 RepID=UPI001266598C|nr:LacI family DNA-binding transcriptional regulator [Microlunatus speluncae]
MASTSSDSRRRTLADVARAVGLSVNTVSRALNDLSGVSEATRVRIKAEADRLGYRPNVHARSLVLGSRRTIGLVITNVSNPFYADLISEIESHAADAGFTLMLLLSDESEGREVEAAETAAKSGVDGVIVVPVQGRHNPWVSLAKAGIPVVVVNRELAGFDADFVSTDNEAGAYAATSHVIERGATSVVLIEEDLAISTIANRTAGFRRALDDHGLTFDDRSVVTVPTRRSSRAALPWQADDSYRLAADLLDRGHRPDAFFVGNDYFALGLYRALAEHDLTVPDDVLVVGFGDYPFSAFLAPSLSTVRLPSRQVAGAAIERLLARLDGSAPESRLSSYIQPELVSRGSTKR